MPYICTEVFESGAILQYLAEKYHELIASEDPHDRVNTITWLMWSSSALSAQAKVYYIDMELVN